MINVDLIKVSDKSLDYSKNKAKKGLQDDDNIFALAARNNGMEKLANFLSNDWSANTARKAGFNKFANWLDNKTEDGKELNDKGFFSNLVREAIKHPIVTVATVATTIFLGKKLGNILKKNINTKKAIDTANKTVVNTAPSVTSASLVSPVSNPNLTPAQLQKIVDEGLAYEQKINFSNLEILKDLSPAERQRLLNHFQYPVQQERLLSFASGASPAMLEVSLVDNIFDVLRSPSVKVVETFDKEVGTLILNSSASKKIIKANKLFFAQRLGLPETASVEQIFSIISKSSTSPFTDTQKYSDLLHLLTGSLKKNATYAQLLQDIDIAEKYKRFDASYVSFFKKSAKGLDSFKQALMDILKSPKSSYSEMPQSFKDEVMKMIDSITLEEYARRLGKPSRFFQDTKYRVQKYEALKLLATKLDNARKTGSSIGLI